ncbi:DUF551 domain-containing protein [Shinella sp. JR1-6]|uniref:DUF551 domain-containing protein n=1 Tax=Shinella sp. JR1-6 TaxID=2527671 RepID=UPI0014055726|nr:DUF551 domain-containing protein [Shinella sp. JR1-6]
MTQSPINAGPHLSAASGGKPSIPSPDAGGVKMDGRHHPGRSDVKSAHASAKSGQATNHAPQTDEIPDDIIEAAENAAILIGQTDGDLIEMTGIIAKALCVERQRDQWQPIETAPMDGTSILVAEAVRPGVDMVSWKGGKKHGAWHTEDGSASYVEGFFTHWQPLPAAPKGGVA